MIKLNHSPKIILIDDDPFHHLILNKNLKKIGLQTTITSYFTGLEGINHILTEKLTYQGYPKSIVFLDINMPIMDGWEFLERFRELDKSIKSNYLVYILSSSILTVEREKASTFQEVFGYFQKPLLIENLEWILNEYKETLPLGVILNFVVK